MPKTFTPKHHSNTSKLADAFMEGPGEQCLRNIFAYAKALDVVHTSSAGQVDLIMN